LHSNPFTALSILYSSANISRRNGHDITQHYHDHDHDYDHDHEDEESIPELIEIDAVRGLTPRGESIAEARMAIENIPYALPRRIPRPKQRK
jgi:hypothetical protein